MSDAQAIELRARQQAAENVEKRLMFFMLQFDPVSGLKIGDAKAIAAWARTVAFEEFQPEQPG